MDITEDPLLHPDDNKQCVQLLCYDSREIFDVHACLLCGDEM